MAKTLQGVAIDSNRFTYTEGKFVTEASDLSDKELYQQIYPDSADAGFPMRSVKTGARVWFGYSKEEKDREGDVTYWEFKPIPEDVRRFPQLRNVSVLVFND